MIEKIILPIAVFIVILIALTFGETLGAQMLAWVSQLTGLVMHNFADVYHAVQAYISAHATKVLIALLLTVPISFWILKNKHHDMARRTSHRKIAIVLAIFLGWLGGHRFYLGQIGWGIFYLVLFFLFAPLVIVISLIDAIRYLFMSDDDFTPANKPAIRQP